MSLNRDQGKNALLRIPIDTLAVFSTPRFQPIKKGVSTLYSRSDLQPPSLSTVRYHPVIIAGYTCIGYGEQPGEPISNHPVKSRDIP